jgi:hypothetical protein
MSESAIDFFTSTTPVDLEPLPGLPKASKYRVITEKHLKLVAKEMQMGMRELARMSRPPTMTPAERREQRAFQARERRAAEAVKRAIL